MKACCSCREWKHLNAFHNRKRSADGRQSRCKECFRDQYRAETDLLRAAIDARLVRVQADNKIRLAAFLAANPCVDCGETDIRVLDFDHRDAKQKRANISRMLRSFSWKTIETEIAKCDVVCANCHRRRTAVRGGWWRQLVHEESVANLP
jgi:hypothetical protein